MIFSDSSHDEEIFKYIDETAEESTFFEENRVFFLNAASLPDNSEQCDEETMNYAYSICAARKSVFYYLSFVLFNLCCNSIQKYASPDEFMQIIRREVIELYNEGRKEVQPES